MTKINLTNKTIESINIEAGSKRKKIPSSVESGLFLIVHPSGTKTWSFRFQSPGSRKRTEINLGKWPQIDQGQAAIKVQDHKKSLKL